MGCAASVEDEGKRNKKGKAKGKNIEPAPAHAAVPNAVPVSEQPKPIEPVLTSVPVSTTIPIPTPIPTPTPIPIPIPTSTLAAPVPNPIVVQNVATPTRQARIAVVYYSMYGHVLQLAEQIAEGVRRAGAIVDIYQVSETLPEEVLQKMHAPPKAAYPTIAPTTLTEYDGFLFGIPTRYGIWPTQWKAFLDSTGQIWQSGGFHGKMGGVFTSTASQHGGVETTSLNALTFFVHHGILFVPLGCAKSFPELTNLSEVVGGSPYGAGTVAGGDGSRQPTEIEKKMCQIQGECFAETVKRHCH